MKISTCMFTVSTQTGLLFYMPTILLLSWNIILHAYRFVTQLEYYSTCLPFCYYHNRVVKIDLHYEQLRKSMFYDSTFLSPWAVQAWKSCLCSRKFIIIWSSTIKRSQNTAYKYFLYRFVHIDAFQYSHNEELFSFTPILK